MQGYVQVYQSENNGCVLWHPHHGIDELLANLTAAVILANHGFAIQLLPLLTQGQKELRQTFLYDVYGSKNPDIRINWAWIGDIKTPDISSEVKKATINRAIYSAAHQKVDIVVINLAGREYRPQEIKRGLIGALQPYRNKSIKEVWLITHHKSLLRIQRDDIYGKQLIEDLIKTAKAITPYGETALLRSSQAHPRARQN